MHLIWTWRGRAGLAAILAIAAGGLALSLGAAPGAEAQTGPTATIKQITLSGAEEVPAVTVNGTGTFSGTLSEDKLEFDLSAVAPDITQAHIHAGAKGANGPVVAFLFGPANPAVGAIHPTGTITVANLVGPLAGNWKGFSDAMAKGELYVNVHTTANPAGAVRAQIPATALPTAPKPPATGDSVVGPSENGYAQLAGVVLVTASLVTLAFAVSRRRV